MFVWPSLAEYGEARDTYDAFNDDGNAHSLLNYVTDAGHSSAEVRDALQSVAPAASAGVFEAAFARSPSMSAWHLTQALISNSPLEPEVMRLMYASGLPSAYIALVENAQTGELNPLTLLKGEMAEANNAKYEALYDLGRQTWLDTLGADPDSLRLWHEYLPARNNGTEIAGVYQAMDASTALNELATAPEYASTLPVLYGVLDHWAAEQAAAGWLAPSGDTRAFLENAKAEDHLGSAMAAAWLEALTGEGHEPHILLPTANSAKRATQPPTFREADTPLTLEAYPNPANTTLTLVFTVPEEASTAELNLHDLGGRVLQRVQLAGGLGIVEVRTETFAPGLYLADLGVEGMLVNSIKIDVQH